MALCGYCSKTRHGGRHLAVRLTIDVYAAKNLFFKPRWHHAAIALTAAHCDRHLAVRLTIDVYAAKNLFLKPRWHYMAIAPNLATAAAKGESRHVLRARLRKKSPRERQPKQDVRRSEGKREKLSLHRINAGTSMFRFPAEGNKNPCRESFGGVEPFPKGSTKKPRPSQKGPRKKLFS